MIIYYKVIEVWCKYPFHTEIDYRCCVFSTSKKKFEKNKIPDFKMDSNTTIEEKRVALEKALGKKVLKVEKIK